MRGLKGLVVAVAVAWVCSLGSRGVIAEEADKTPADPNEIRIQEFTLADQFGERFECTLPLDRPILLLVADHRGYQTLEPWIVAAREEFIDHATIVGVADLRTVPGFLRGKVQKQFEKAKGYPVLLDWKGDVLDQVKPQKHVPNIYVVDLEGRSSLHLAGEATPGKIQKVREALDDSFNLAVNASR